MSQLLVHVLQYVVDLDLVPKFYLLLAKFEPI
jgi:hypothetical protein